MAKDGRKDSITVWAWSLSLAAHLALLAIFAVVRFSKPQQGPASQPGSIVTINQIKAIAESSLIIPKPGIKSQFRLLPKARHKSMINLSVVHEVEMSGSDQSVPEIPNADSTGLLGGDSLSVPRAEFFESYTDQRKICYVVDCSGSMQGLFSHIRKQLKNSIAELKPDQYFYIIFFGGDKLAESAKGRLVRATDKAKSRAYKFIDGIKPGGQTNALSAIERAMQIRGPGDQAPALIYFLTDGFELQGRQGTNLSSTVEILQKKLAPTTKINTIGFWTEYADRRILRTIASQSGGEFINVE